MTIYETDLKALKAQTEKFKYGEGVYVPAAGEDMLTVTLRED